MNKIFLLIVALVALCLASPALYDFDDYVAIALADGRAFCTSFIHYNPSTTTKLSTITPATATTTVVQLIVATETDTIAAAQKRTARLKERNVPTPTRSRGLATSLLSSVCSKVATGTVTKTVLETAPTPFITVLSTTTSTATTTTTTTAPTCAITTVAGSLDRAPANIVETTYNITLPFPILFPGFSIDTVQMASDGAIGEALVCSGDSTLCGNVGARSIEFQWYTGYAGIDPDQVFQFSILYEEGVIGVFVYRYYQMFAVGNPAFVTVAGSPPQGPGIPGGTPATYTGALPTAPPVMSLIYNANDGTIG